MERQLTTEFWFSRHCGAAKGAILAVLVASALICQAQTNSWTNSGSGNWEDPYWSLGMLPGTNQIILFTNDGTKTLLIGPKTANAFPGSLMVGAIVLGGETGSTNTLLLNEVELGIPYFVDVETNSALAMRSSALSGGDFSLGGTLTATDSRIQFSSLTIGNTGPGVMNVTNSIITWAWGRDIEEYVGGNYPALVQQCGGTNFGTIEIDAGGEYRLFGGSVTRQNRPGQIVLRGGNFSQFGGKVDESLWFVGWNCEYHLGGGILSCGELDIPSKWGLSKNRVRQTGGTNLASVIRLGNSGGPGSYRLEGGFLQASNLFLISYQGPNPNAPVEGSDFYQSGGCHTNNAICIQGGEGIDNYVRFSAYYLTNGIVATPIMALTDGAVLQSGGTNQVGNISLAGLSNYLLSGGWLTAQKIGMTGGYGFHGQANAIQQSGGTNHVSDDLSLALSTCTLSGGELFARNVSLSQSAFYHTGGVAHVPGCLTLTGGTWGEQTASQQFGVLQLATEQGVSSNSRLQLASGTCIIQFSDSSSLTWSNSAALTITNWSGSLYGGGSQQIIFGSNAAGLTPQQLSQIQFENPVGIPPGTYAARILATGEIVPDTGAPLPPRIEFSGSPMSGSVQLRVGGNIGEVYGIETSTDLVHWMIWTSHDNATGTIPFTDAHSTNSFRRFYRARLLPSE